MERGGMLGGFLDDLRTGAWTDHVRVGAWIEDIVDILLDNVTPVFDAIALVIGSIATTLESALIGLPAWLMIALLAGLGLWRVGWRFALFVVGAMLLIIGMGMWTQTMSTLALVLGATFVALLLGIPVGIAMAKSDLAEALVRPVLDIMQTMPAFVYLIPAVMFFGLGKVPGTIATVIFAMPPAVRLTNLGIRQVPKEMVEAGLAFGCTGRQLLFRVQIPSAMPSIMAGVNQTIMLALSMVVIASMIGAGGLGTEVLRGIQRLNIGLGFEGGLGVVILAVVLDRITQSFGHQRQAGGLLQRLRTVLFTPGSHAGARAPSPQLGFTEPSEAAKRQP
jgi:glycine betaine/proline transport system permease protein